MPYLPRISSDGAFLEFPGLLVIRLMSRCNQRCIFCMTRDEIGAADTVDTDQALRVIARQAAGARVEFFGGEPTIHPRFIDLVRAARDRGHQCSMATNGRKLADDAFIDRLAEFGSDQIYLRTSVYGDSAGVHDGYTNVRGSYRETRRGIANAVARGFPVQVNIVILERNFERLREFSEQVGSWGVTRIKFGNLIEVQSCQPHAVPLSRVSPYLIDAIAVSERLGLDVTVEKTPVCAIGGRLDLVSTERELGQWPRQYDDDGACERCLVRPWCDGLDPGYVSLFGYDGIARLDRVPATVVERRPGQRPEFLKTFCVRVDSPEFDDDTVRKLNATLQEVNEQYGRLAVFPSRTIDEPAPGS